MRRTAATGNCEQNFYLLSLLYTQVVQRPAKSRQSRKTNPHCEIKTINQGRNKPPNFLFFKQLSQIFSGHYFMEFLSFYKTNLQSNQSLRSLLTKPKTKHSTKEQRDEAGVQKIQTIFDPSDEPTNGCHVDIATLLLYNHAIHRVAHVNTALELALAGCRLCEGVINLVEQSSD